MKKATQSTTAIFHPVEVPEATRQLYEALRLTESEVQSLKIRSTNTPPANLAA